MFTTIQDLGRSGYRAMGISPGGAMDHFAASVANYLVGNDKKQPVIEMHFPAPEILFEEDALISITGADFNAFVDDQPIAPWKPHCIKRNEKLRFKKYLKGARSYLAIDGGMASGEWLNSFSTNTKVKAGGHMGRPLAKEDIIFVNPAIVSKAFTNFPDFSKEIDTVYQPENIIRCIAGPEWNLLNDAAKQTFTNMLFSITPQSDRMGFRLNGMDILLDHPVQLISSAVDSGTIQLLPNGQLILLMADHQTTGGYPRIANVISADLPKLAQATVHSQLQFELTGIENAEDALFSLYQTMASIKNGCKNYYDAD